jgi:uncharacterized protein (DUF1330 family)
MQPRLDGGLFGVRRQGRTVPDLSNLIAPDALRRGYRRGTAVEIPMTVYAVAQLRFTDRDAYDRYQARFMEVFTRFSGRLLAADEAPRVVEGTWDRQKLVLMSFPDEGAFRAWAESPAYREISRDRRAGADAVVLLARGLDAPG